MFIILPDELIRKIICKLDIKHFVFMCCINRSINNMNLCKSLLPWRIEGYYDINENISIKERKELYIQFINGIPVTDLVSDLIVSINKMIGDYTIYDYNFEFNKRIEKNLYRQLYGINPLRYKRDYSNNLYLKAIL